jgi:hypothetical protein
MMNYIKPIGDNIFINIAIGIISLGVILLIKRNKK